MPDADAILRGPTRIANEALPLAVLWHLIVGVVLVAVLLGIWRPSRRVGAMALALPFLSVGGLAWVTGNPFNGGVFVGGGLLFLALGARLGTDPVRRGPGWAVAFGVASLAYAWLYPHFLEARPLYFYLFAAPMALIPCPTLALVLGFTLLAGGFQSRAWSLTLGVLGLFYALFGMFRLGVWLDAGLLAFAAALTAYALRCLPSRSRTAAG